MKLAFLICLFWRTYSKNDIGKVLQDSHLLIGVQSDYPKTADISRDIARDSFLYSYYVEVNVSFDQEDDLEYFDISNPDSVEEYHKALALFGLEMTVIYATVWYTPSFKIVGMVYRWSGLNRFAFKYPTLISFILSKAHWGIRGTLVEGSTGIADYIFDSFGLIHGIRD